MYVCTLRRLAPMSGAEGAESLRELLHSSRAGVPWKVCLHMLLLGNTGNRSKRRKLICIQIDVSKKQSRDSSRRSSVLSYGLPFV